MSRGNYSPIIIRSHTTILIVFFLLSYLSNIHIQELFADNEQKLSAEQLTEILRTATEPVVLEGETIDKDLNLSGIDVSVAVSLKNFNFTGTVDFSLAQTAGLLNLSGSTFEKGLSLEGTRIGHHLILDGCSFKSASQSETALDTRRMEVKGDLLLRNNPKFHAHWDGEDMQIQGGVLIEGLTMEGTPPPVVRLNQTRVGGSLTINKTSFGKMELQTSRIGLELNILNSQFTDEAKFYGIYIGGLAGFKGVSLMKIIFDGAEIKGDLFFWPDDKGNPCSIVKEAKFIGTHIGGQANFIGVSFKDRVAFDRAEIKGGIFFLPDDRGNPCSIGGEARFHGAHIGGQMNFLQVICNSDVFFIDASIDSKVNFKGANFKKAVFFDGANVKSDLRFSPDDKGNPCIIEGQARFNGIYVGGQACFLGISLKGDIFFDRAEVRSDLFFQPDDKGNPCSIEGDGRFHGAKIGGQAGFLGTSFMNKMFFDEAEVKGGLFLWPDDRGNPCSIGGEARFHGAHIGGQVNFKRVLFKEEVLFQGTHVDGEVIVIGTEIPKFMAVGARFSKTLEINSGTKIEDLVLKGVKVGTLNIDWGSISGKLELMGCEYGSVEDKEKLLEILLAKRVRESQPYEFLENYCRRIGEGDFANDIYYEWRCLVAPRWEWGLSTGIGYIWDWLLKWSAGYGVKPHRMLCWLVVSFVFGIFLFKCPVMIKFKVCAQVTSNIPGWWEAAWLSLVNLLPDIPGKYPEVENRWQLTLAGAYLTVGIRLLGWLVVTVGGLATTGIFSRYSP